MSSENIRIPREHDRVTTSERHGVFVIVDVDENGKTAVLQTVTGDGPLVEGVPWATLQYMDEEDANYTAP